MVKKGWVKEVVIPPMDTVEVQLNEVEAGFDNECDLHLSVVKWEAAPSKQVLPRILYFWARSYQDPGQILQVSRNKCRVLATMARCQDLMLLLGKILARSYRCQEINTASWRQWQDVKIYI